MGRYGSTSQAELEPILLHEARHTYRSFLRAARIWPEDANCYLGHADQTTPGRYSHQFDDQLAADAATFERYISGGARDNARQSVPISSGQ